MPHFFKDKNKVELVRQGQGVERMGLNGWSRSSRGQDRDSLIILKYRNT